MKRVILSSSDEITPTKKAALTKRAKIEIVENIKDYLDKYDLPYGEITCEKQRDKSGRVGIPGSFVVYISAEDGHYIGALEVPVSAPYKLWVTSGTDAFTREWGFTDDMFDDILDIFVDAIEPIEKSQEKFDKRTKELQEWWDDFESRNF